MFSSEDRVGLLETTHFCPKPIYSTSKFECIQFLAVQLHNSIMEDRNVQEEGVAQENLSFCYVILMRHNIVCCCHITGPVLHVPLNGGGGAGLPSRPSDLLRLYLKSPKEGIFSSI